MPSFFQFVREDKSRHVSSWVLLDSSFERYFILNEVVSSCTMNKNRATSKSDRDVTEAEAALVSVLSNTSRVGSGHSDITPSFGFCPVHLLRGPLSDNLATEVAPHEALSFGECASESLRPQRGRFADRHEFLSRQVEQILRRDGDARAARPHHLLRRMDMRLGVLEVHCIDLEVIEGRRSRGPAKE